MEKDLRAMHDWSKYEVQYEIVPGIFTHDDPDVPPETIPAVPARFGLIESSAHGWSNLMAEVSRMNRESDSNIFYKVIYLGRHGQGYHNVAEANYGTEAWDSYWSRLNGDGNITWGPDAELTDLGVLQAQEINARWKEELPRSIPVPTKLFSSPLQRAARTLELCFQGIPTTKPLIMENLREVLGEHTCDKRSTRSYLEAAFPTFEIEASLTEDDELWRADERETEHHLNERVKRALDQIFVTCLQDTYLAIFAHGGVIRAVFHAMDHRPLAVKTGGVVPILLKGILCNV
ncbi:hypothetical protein FRC02_006337 [Tulasnella sp. 418]|nr:hypothetical protein FRC02_006337 [Tulasnella sp. 418]